MKKWILYLLITAGAIVVAVAACVVIVNSFRSAPEKKSYHMVVIMKATGNSSEFWQSFREGVRTAADEMNIKVEITGAKNESMVTRQITIVNQAIKEKPDVILLSASDYKLLSPVAKKVTEEGIKLITFDSDVDFPGKLGFIATDNEKVGKKLGSLLDRKISSSSKYIILEHSTGATTAVDRVKGVKEAVTNSASRLLGTFSCNDSSPLAKRITLEELKKHPEIKGIVAVNEIAALGVAEGVKKAGLAGKVKVVSCDSSYELVQYMEQGVIQAFVVQRPFNMGYLSIKTAYNALQGKKIPVYYDTGSVTITRKNMYTSVNQKLLFPFNTINKQTRASESR